MGSSSSGTGRFVGTFSNTCSSEVPAIFEIVVTPYAYKDDLGALLGRDKVAYSCRSLSRESIQRYTASYTSLYMPRQLLLHLVDYI